jgi:HlyD family secretion protein
MSDSVWKIETNVPEVDVAKIAVGDPARISFDAYGTDVIFAAKVISIDPAETIIEGVSTYKVTLVLDEKDDRILSGMTANIDISTDKREDVLMVPFRAVLSKDDGKYVRIPSADGLTATEKKVEIGLRGSDGNVEVLNGLVAGEQVVIYEKK